MHRRGVGADEGPSGGRVVAWRLSRTWTRLRALCLLQWHQVSPGAASTQAHLQGYLWAAVRGEHQAQAAFPPPSRPCTQVDRAHSAQAAT